jgi:hypothetical protein
MSTLPDNEFDLEKLFLPAWAQQEPSSTKYAKYEGEAARPDRRDGNRGPRPPRRDGPPGGRRDGNRPGGDRRGPPRPEGGRDRPAGPGNRPPFRRDDDRQPRERREMPAPLPELNVSLIPDERGVESLARQIKMSGRAYPLFDIAQMILQKPERHVVVFSIKKNAEGQPVQPLFVCALDDTLWLSEDEAIAHVLKKHFGTFYQAERTATEPPKGKYTFVAQCGMSGAVLGPPNHHDYQNQLRKLHTERFSRMPFEVYKSRVRIVRDEEVVKKWVDDQSWKTEYVCLNMPEPLKLASMEAVEQHFRQQHKENIIKPVETHTLNGLAARSLRSPELVRLSRSVWEDQRRFPLQIATVLSQQFAGHGLQFFKVNKTVTHVSVARPHYLDLAATPVSEGVKSIVDYINSRPRCNRRQLVEALAPTPPPAPIPVVPAAPAAPAPATEAAPIEGQLTGPAATPAAPPQPQAAQPTSEQTAIIADLHWLVHQGHVIEFANGILEMAKKPLPKPPKPEAKPKPAEAAPQAEAPVAGEVTGAAPATDAGPDDSAKPADGAALEPSPEAATAAPTPEAAPVGAPAEAPAAGSVAVPSEPVSPGQSPAEPSVTPAATDATAV